MKNYKLIYVIILCIMLVYNSAFGGDWMTVSGDVAPFGRPDHLYPNHISVKINLGEISVVQNSQIQDVNILTVKNANSNILFALFCDSSDTGKRVLASIEEAISKKNMTNYAVKKPCMLIDEGGQKLIATFLQ